MTRTELITWAYLAALALSIDQVMAWRRWHGRCSEQASRETQALAAKLGGIGTLVTLCVLGDILLPPLALVGCFLAYRKELARRREARDR
jgi:hypothetical protein